MAMLAGAEDISVHFARFRVTQINLGESASRQFRLEPMLQAAELLADARVASICWSGTSAAWLGLNTDRALCAAIAKRTGIPACTSILGLMDALHRLGARRIGLVTPYLDEVQQAIIATLSAEGIKCIAERHLNDPGNFSFALHAPAQVAGLVCDVAKARPEAIAIVCTNLRGAGLAATLEAELGIPVLDSVATGLWAGLRQAGVPTERFTAHGSLFRLA